MLKTTSARANGFLSPFHSNYASGNMFSPTSIDGLALWLDAAAITGLSDNDAVTTWNDSSSANSAGQATAGKKPTYKTNIQNGKPVVRFDGSTDFMSLATYVDAGNSTLFVVCNRTSGSGYQGLFVTNKIGIYSNNGSEWIVYVGGDKSGGSSVDSNFKVLTARIQDNAATVDLWTNGTPGSTQTGGSFDARGSTTVIGSGWIDSQHHGGDIAEMLIYTAVLSDADVDTINDYLNARWAVY